MRRSNPRRDVAGPGGPAPYGDPQVPSVPVPIPIVAVAALMGAFALGRASGKMLWFGGGPCWAVSRGCAEPPRRVAGCGSRCEGERPGDGEEPVGA